MTESGPGERFGEPFLEMEDFARMSVDEASEALGSDVALLDLRGISAFADFFVIASGETPRHLESMADDVTRALRANGLRIHHREGVGQGGWILLDFSGLVVHFFSRAAREYYGLDRLWNRAPEIVRVQ
jgi:ribosome-associated protein